MVCSAGPSISCLHLQELQKETEVPEMMHCPMQDALPWATLGFGALQLFPAHITSSKLSIVVQEAVLQRRQKYKI